MNTEYLLRGKIIPELTKEGEYAIPTISIPASLPITLGQFIINRCPNYEAYIEDMIEGEAHHEVDDNYPFSLYYVDIRVKVADEDNPIPKAEEALRNLEAMLRLYQPGGIYIRRGWQVWKIEQGSLHETIFLHFGSNQPEPDFYSLGGYKFDDEFLLGFSNFFNRFWPVIGVRKYQAIFNSLMRFSSSYEKFTLADRLIDLMISLEALFNESPDSIAYKLSLRCSSLIASNQREKKGYFYELKTLYNNRNLIVHGEKSRKKIIDITDEKVNHLQNIARKSIISFMALAIEKFPIDDLNALDNKLFFNE